MLGFQAFRSASKILKGIEVLNMVKKEQIKNLNYSCLDELRYINR
jgi:transposase-like protein